MNFFKKIMKKTKENKNDIKNKENIQKIEQELEGYTEYKKKVKYKLIPFVW